MGLKTLQLLFAVFLCFFLLEFSKGDRYVMHLVENGTRFDEEVEIDVDNGVQKFKVPPHNNVEGAEFLNDFNLGMTAVKMPLKNVCYISKLLPSLARPRKMQADMTMASQRRTNKVSINSVQHKWSVREAVNSSALPKSLADFCGNLPVYRTVLTDDPAGPFTVRKRRQTIDSNGIVPCDKAQFQKDLIRCNADNIAIQVLKCRFTRHNCFYYFKCFRQIIQQREIYTCQQVDHFLNTYTVCCDYEVCQPMPNTKG